MTTTRVALCGAPAGRPCVLVPAALVLATPAARARGFAGRAGALAPGEAAWFVFPGDVAAPFTMAATGVPLDILFVAAAGRVVGAHLGARPYDPAPYAPPAGARYRYALELPAGWLASRGLPDPRGAAAAWDPAGDWFTARD